MKKKYAILGGGEFYDINYFDSEAPIKYTSRNFRKVQELCDKLQSLFPFLKFNVVKIKKVKENI